MGVHGEVRGIIYGGDDEFQDFAIENQINFAKVRGFSSYGKGCLSQTSSGGVTTLDLNLPSVKWDPDDDLELAWLSLLDVAEEHGLEYEFIWMNGPIENERVTTILASDNHDLRLDFEQRVRLR